MMKTEETRITWHTMIKIYWVFLYFLIIAFMAWFQYWGFNMNKRCGCNVGSTGPVAIMKITSVLTLAGFIYKLATSTSLWTDLAILAAIFAFFIAAKVFIERVEEKEECKRCVDDKTLAATKYLFYLFVLKAVIFISFCGIWIAIGKAGP